MANAFAYECRSSEEEVDAQQFAESVIKNDAKADNGKPFTDLEFYDVENYVSLELSQCTYLTRLTRSGFWRLLRDRNRVSSLNQQIALICWLWGRNEALSRLFRRCLLVLKKIESEDIWVERASLVPRETGILYVQYLRRHLRRADDEHARVYFGNGVKGRLPKSVLAV